MTPNNRSAGSVRDWTLSDDGRRMTIDRDGPQGGTVTTTLEWKQRATREQIAKALSLPPTFTPSQAAEGESRFGRTWRTRRGEWFYFMVKGPPTWWLPHFWLERWGFRCGWLRIAISITWKRRGSGEGG